jgi:hypothetical protein
MLRETGRPAYSAEIRRFAGRSEGTSGFKRLFGRERDLKDKILRN